MSDDSRTIAAGVEALEKYAKKMASAPALKVMVAYRDTLLSGVASVREERLTVRRQARLRERMADVERAWRQLGDQQAHSQADVAAAMDPPRDERTIRRFLHEWEETFGETIHWPPPWP